MFTKSVFRVRHKGFTIIELLIVITILALLTALAATSYLAAAVRSRDSARKAAVNTIAGAVETYYSTQRKFPGDAYLPGIKITPSDFTMHKCKTYDLFNGNDVFPYYFYKPTVDCGSGPLGSGYNPVDFQPKGTWIPGLGQYLNPFPLEAKFINKYGGTNGTIDEITDPNEILSSFSSANDPSRTLVYRNLTNSYIIYSRLESKDDSDFKIRFSIIDNNSNTYCMPNYPVTITDGSLSCISVMPYNPPMKIVYLVSK